MNTLLTFHRSGTGPADRRAGRVPSLPMRAIHPPRQPAIPDEGRSAMKYSICLLFVLLAVGCTADSDRARGSDHRVGVLKSAPGEYMFVASSGKKAGFSALEFKEIALTYARQRKLAFDFKNTECTIWIHTDGSRAIASVTFMAGMGDPVLEVRIDKDGKVTDHSIGIAVCGS